MQLEIQSIQLIPFSIRIFRQFIKPKKANALQVIGVYDLDPELVAEGPEPRPVPALDDADVVREPLLEPVVEAGDQVDVVVERHQAVVAQDVPLRLHSPT